MEAWKNSVRADEPRTARDENHLASALHKSRERFSAFPTKGDASGGAMRKMVAVDAIPFNSLEAVRVPAKFGAFRQQHPTSELGNYYYFEPADRVPWRVVIPKQETWVGALARLRMLRNRGPQGAGFARVGDTLVPRYLSPVAQRALAQVQLRS
jgi:hypothetical protein